MAKKYLSVERLLEIDGFLQKMFEDKPFGKVIGLAFGGSVFQTQGVVQGFAIVKTVLKKAGAQIDDQELAEYLVIQDYCLERWFQTDEQRPLKTLPKLKDFAAQHRLPPDKFLEYFSFKKQVYEEMYHNNRKMLQDLTLGDDQII